MFKKVLKNRFLKGFTLIELLVVISIIGLLSSVILSSLAQSKKKAQVSKVQQEMRQIMNAMTIIADDNDLYLYQISPGQQYTAACTSACPGPDSCLGKNLIGDTSSCYTRWVDVLEALQTYSKGLYPKLTVFSRDVWGSPYLIDENAGVHGQQCATDYILSVGPDGVAGGSDDIVIRGQFKALGKTFLVGDLGSFPITFYNQNKCTCTALNTCTPVGTYQ